MKNFISRKERTIDYNFPVRVYRNLNRNGFLYSILQNGLVIDYSEEIMLSNAKFIVNMTAKRRIIETKNRTVHAYLEGFIIEGSLTQGTDFYYSPFEDQIAQVKEYVYINQKKIITNNKII